MRVAIGSDHAGFQLKEHLKGQLSDGGHEVIDLGTDSEEPVDYPPICAGVGKEVAAGRAERGIVLGGSGQGEQISANKVRGVRAGSATTSTPRNTRGATTTPTCCRSAPASWPRVSRTRSCGSGWSPSSKAAATSAASTRSPNSNPSDRLMNGPAHAVTEASGASAGRSPASERPRAGYPGSQGASGA